MSKIDDLVKEKCLEEVEYKTLGELGRFYGGLTGKSKEDFNNGNAIFITYKNVFLNSALNITPEDRVKIAEGERQHTLQYGDIIFTGSSETPEECGFSSVVTEVPKEELYLNSFCFFFRLNDVELFYPDFVRHLFRSSVMRKQIVKTASGVTRFNVSKKLMEKVKVPIIPIAIQKEIAEVLNNMSELEAGLEAGLEAELLKRKQQHEHYRECLFDFKKSQQVEKYSLRELVEFKNGKGHERDIVSDGNYLVVNSKFISTEGKVVKYSDKQICPLYKDDICMVMSDLPNGKALAKCYLVDSDRKYSLNQRIGAFRNKDSKKILNKYLFYILNRNPQLLRYDNGIDQTNLRKDEILNITIPIPPIDIQERIIRILDSLDAVYGDLAIGLSAEIKARHRQYEYYRDKLLTFKERVV